MIGMKRLVAGYLLCILNIIESGMKGKKNKPDGSVLTNNPVLVAILSKKRLIHSLYCPDFLTGWMIPRWNSFTR